jgi:hypothetical protein
MVFSMNNIKLFKVDLMTLTPVIVGVRGSERGVLYTSPKRVIPGVTFHGAFMKALSDLGAKVVNEETALKIYTTPLYPTLDSSKYLFKDVSVAHALSLYGKGSKQKRITPYDGEIKQRYVISCGLRRLLEDFSVKKYDLLTCVSSTIKNFISELESKAVKYGVELLFNAADMKSAQGSPIMREGNLWYITPVKKGMYIENVVDNVRRSVHVGVLYGYEFIMHGTLFTGYIACYEGNNLCDEIKDLAKTSRSIEVFIGKGQGRGFGKSEVRISELSITVLRDLLPIKEELFIANTLAPTFVMNILPRPIASGDAIETLSGFRFRVLGVIGSNTEVYSGWSRLHHTPKVSIRCNTPGTLLIMKSEDGVISEEVCIELLLGLVKGGLPGFNIIQPIVWSVREDPLYVNLDDFLRMWC